MEKIIARHIKLDQDAASMINVKAVPRHFCFVVMGVPVIMILLLLKHLIDLRKYPAA
ncbi:MAG: hypothetical protein LBE17_14065 [Treponema sp.]|nr:hypothetical protein [Treponema sp.]